MAALTAYSHAFFPFPTLELTTPIFCLFGFHDRAFHRGIDNAIAQRAALPAREHHLGSENNNGEERLVVSPTMCTRWAYEQSIHVCSPSPYHPNRHTSHATERAREQELALEPCQVGANHGKS